jgi:uncharacterized protein (TIGR00288 family)
MENENMIFKAGLFVDGSNIFRSDFPIDYKALLDHVARDHNLLRATAYIVVDPENPDKSQPFVHFLMSTGFKVVQRPLMRTMDGAVRASTSVALAVDMLEMSKNLDVMVLVSGDANLVPAVEHIQRTGKRVEVIAFVDRSSKEIQDAADHFFPLQKVEGIARDGGRGEFRSFGDDDDAEDDGGVGGSGDEKSPEEP